MIKYFTSGQRCSRMIDLDLDHGMETVNLPSTKINISALGIRWKKDALPSNGYSERYLLQLSIKGAEDVFLIHRK